MANTFKKVPKVKLKFSEKWKLKRDKTYTKSFLKYKLKKQ